IYDAMAVSRNTWDPTCSLQNMVHRHNMPWSRINSVYGTYHTSQYALHPGSTQFMAHHQKPLPTYVCANSCLRHTLHASNHARQEARTAISRIWVRTPGSGVSWLPDISGKQCFM